MNVSTLTDDTSKRFSMFPLVWLAAAFGFGIAGGYLIGLDWSASLISASVLGFLAFLIKGVHSSSFLIVFAFIFAGAFCYQFDIASLRVDRVRRLYDEGKITSGTPVEIEGT